MRTDRQMTALFAAAAVEEAPDPTFLDELFELLVDEAAALRPATVPARARTLLRRRSTASGHVLRLRFLAAAAAVVLAIVGGIGLLGRSPAVIGGPSPAPSPSPTVAPTQPVSPSSTSKKFVSTAYAYSIDYPSNWKSNSSPGQLDFLTYPYDFSGGVDYFSATSPDVSDPGLIIGAPVAPAGTTLDSWIATIQGLQANTLACAPADATEPVTIGGQPGRLLTWLDCPEYLLWAGVVRGDRAYHVLLIDQYAVDNPALQAADKQLFLRIIGTLTFTGPIETARPSAGPSRPRATP